MIIFQMETPEQWRERQKRNAEEENRKYFLEVSKHFGEAIDKLGIFNSFYYGNYGDGISCLLSLKKYPNVYACFRYAIDCIPTSIMFQCYMYEHKWSKIYVPFLDFLDMVGFKPEKPKTFLDNLFNRKQEEHTPRFFTKDKLMWMIETDIKTYGFNLKPEMFRFETPDLSFDWCKEEAGKYIKTPKSIAYSMEDGNLKQYVIQPEQMQKKLIKLFTGDYEKS